MSNIEFLKDLSEEFGVHLVLVNYPATWGFYPEANSMIDNAALRFDIPLIDVRPAFSERCPDKKCSGFLHYDGHPLVEGHNLISEVVSRYLREQMFEEHLKR